jgi:hypothetical protein
VVSTWEAIKKRYEETFHPAHVVAGLCKDLRLEQVKDLLEHAKSVTDKAKTVTTIGNDIGVLGEAGEKLEKSVEEIDKVLEKGEKRVLDLDAACDISEAMDVLGDWGLPGSKTSNEEAAKAFDKLFGGAARFMSKLGYPATIYAEYFKAISKYNFFSNMNKEIDPSIRWKRQFDDMNQPGKP